MALKKPDVLVFISPHGIFLRNSLGYVGSRSLRGSFSAFGAPEVFFEVNNDLKIARAIADEARNVGVDVVEIEPQVLKIYQNSELDHGIMVPLYYLKKAGLDAGLVAYGISLLPFEKLFLFGKALRRAVENDTRRIALIASGDLSHRLIPGAPAGFDPHGKVFDEKVRDALERFDVEQILNLPEDLIERAGECGLRPIIMLLGALHSCNVKGHIYSYEGPFGVGYLVAGFRILGSHNENLSNNFEESPFVQLARQSLEHYLRTGQVMAVPEPLPADMDGRAGVFVSIKKHGRLRGCIGTIEPYRKNIAEEIIYNAISAGVDDPRFMPVELEELPQLKISVDVLTQPEPVESEKDLDPKRYGVIVSSGRRKGLLLPDLEGIDTVEEQIRIARQKAGIHPDEPVKLERFEVIRYE